MLPFRIVYSQLANRFAWLHKNNGEFVENTLRCAERDESAQITILYTIFQMARNILSD